MFLENVIISADTHSFHYKFYLWVFKTDCTAVGCAHRNIWPAFATKLFAIAISDKATEEKEEKSWDMNMLKPIVARIFF